MKYIVGFFSLILFTILYSVCTYAQEKTETNQPENTFNFYFINGYAISYNFYEAKSYYLRAQLDLSTSKEDIDSEGETNNELSSSSWQVKGTSNSEKDYFLIGASVYIILPVYETNYGNIYLGTGPAFNYSNQSYSNSESRDEYYPDSNAVQYTMSYSNSNNEKNYDVAFVVLIGIEAFITKNISLIAEANLRGGGRWQNNEWEYVSTSTAGTHSKNSTSSDGNGWFYEAQFIRLGVSISI